MTSKEHDSSRLLLAVLLAAFGLRLLLLGSYPLMDTTEARYAEIARKMLELNDWITPWFDYDVPFWGKPPLCFWMTATSFKLLGINEFAARLPHYLCGALVTWIVWRWTADHVSRRQAGFTSILLAGSLLYFLSSGLVMTDMWLLLGTTLSMFGFWSSVQNIQTGNGYQKWLFFVGLAIGLLSKGPIALVLTGMPVAGWIIVNGKYRASWQSLPWIRGSTLTMALCLPWYILAEIKTPGFAEYFIIGEHVKRFVVPGWQGDLYGTAHDRPTGSIWLMLLMDGLPWSLILPGLFFYLWRHGELVKSGPGSKEWRSYLALWGLMPAVFFTFAGNILWTYLLPGFPALALWASHWLNRQSGVSESAKVTLLVGGTVATLALTLAAVTVLLVGGQGDVNSAKSLVALYQQQKVGDEPLLYLGERRFSVDFYSRGKAEKIDERIELETRVSAASVFVAIESDKLEAVTSKAGNVLTPVASSGGYTLLQSFSSGAGQ